MCVTDPLTHPLLPACLGVPRGLFGAPHHVRFAREAREVRRPYGDRESRLPTGWVKREEIRPYQAKTTLYK